MKKRVWIIFLSLLICMLGTEANAVHNDGLCNSCHSTHSGGALLTRSFNPSINKTQATGVSALCLSCHDTGTENYHKRDGVFGSKTHPVSIVYDSALAAKEDVRDPSSSPSHLGARSNCYINSTGKEICTVVDTGSSNTIQEDLLKAANPSDPNSPKNRLECTSCHDPHNKFNIVHYNYTVSAPSITVRKYMNSSVANMYMCSVCHSSSN